MAETSPKISAEIFKDRRVQIGAAVIALLIIASIVFFTFGGGGGNNDTGSATPGGADGGALPAGENPGTPVIPPVASGPSSSGPGSGGGRGPASGQQTASAGANSFSDAPPGMQLPVGGGVSAPDPNAAFPGSGPGGVGGGPVTAAPGAAKPTPIRSGVPATQPRTDPFISFFRVVTPRPPAYLYAQPLRVASYPKPKVVGTVGTAVADLEPLPFVERRVAGILYNGSVSAILETGPSGPGGQVDVVQPGSRVESGIAGVPDLTVESIGPTELILRSEDNRRVQVKLTGLPEGARPNNPVGGGTGAGDLPGGPGGSGPSGSGPGAGGFPGGRRGGGGRPGAGVE